MPQAYGIKLPNKTVGAYLMKNVGLTFTNLIEFWVIYPNNIRMPAFFAKIFIQFEKGMGKIENGCT